MLLWSPARQASVRGCPRFGRLLLAIACGAGLICSALGCPKAVERRPAHVDSAQQTAFQKGIGLGLFASDADYDYAQLLDEIVAEGATDVLLVVPWYQRDRFSSQMGLREGFSPAWGAIGRTIAQAKRRGLRVAVLPIVRLQKRGPKEWRGVIQPQPDVNAWFAAYRPLLLRLAKIAEAAGAERLGIGSELL